MRNNALLYVDLIMLAVVAIVMGCSVQKKDQRALERVQAKRPLVDKMLPVVRDLYPCVADTEAIIIPGGIDSVFYPVPVIDTVYDRGSAYAEGFIDGQMSVARKKFAMPLPDTIMKTIIDRSGIDGLLRNISYIQGQMLEKDKRIDEFKAMRKEKDWWLYGLIGLLVLTNAAWVFIRMK